MRIICPKCGTEYFLESEQLDPAGTPVQCSACEHTFTVYGAEGATTGERQTDPAAASPKAAPKPTPPPPPQSRPRPPAPKAPSRPPGGSSLFLAQGDRIYKVKDSATLQRWIVEKRILPNDRVSDDGKSWEVVSSRADLRPFFAIIEQLKSAKRELRKVESSASLPQVGAVGTPAVSTGEPPRVHLPGSTLTPPAAARTPTQDGRDDPSSFWKMKDPSQQPEEVQENATSEANLLATRPVPVQRDTASTGPLAAQSDVSTVEQNTILTPTGPTPAISDEDLHPSTLPRPADDFDPDQTFSDVDDTFESAPGSGFLGPMVLGLALLGAGAAWYFLAGPGHADVYSESSPSVLARRDPPTPPAATPDAGPTPEASASPTTVPKEPSHPQATPRPTPRATPRATPKPRSAARPTPKAHSGSPTRRVDYMGQGDTARKHGRFAQAIEAYDKALAADPKNFKAALQSGWMNVELGRNAAAVTSFKKALALRSTSAEAHYGLGLAKQARGQVQAAIAEYKRVIELDPDGRDTREVKAILRQLDP